MTIITDHEEKYVLHYAETTGIAPVKAQVKSQCVSIYGKTIKVEGCKVLSLYTVDGKLVAKSQGDVIVAPAAGLYIIKADGVNTKILIK